VYPKALLLLLLLALTTLAPAAAQDPALDFAHYPLETEADMALARLTTLDSVLDAHPNATAAELRKLDLALPEINSAQPLQIERLLAVPGSERPLGISPFLWGLVLSVPGAFVVYLMTEERRPTHQAIFGAIVGGIALALLYFVVISPL
jgi:hypothetical protein